MKVAIDFKCSDYLTVQVTTMYELSSLFVGFCFHGLVMNFVLWIGTGKKSPC